MSSIYDYLRGKSVLLLAPRFFGIDKKIGAELRGLSRRYFRLYDRPLDGFLGSLFLRLFPLKGPYFFDIYYIYHFFRLSRLAELDVILVINGQTLSPRGCRWLRRLYPNARMILYMWDSLSNRPNGGQIAQFFDACFSFERHHNATDSFRFRPLFGLSHVESNSTQSDHFAFFLGSIHSDRFVVLQRLSKLFKDKEIDHLFYCFLKSKALFFWGRYISRSLKNARLKDFELHPIPNDLGEKYFNKASIILDIENVKQTGLTIRVFDVIFSSKKLITTNSDISNYDFYSESNILIVDRKSPQIPNDFLVAPLQDYSQELKFKYSLVGWLQDILCLHR